MVFIPGWGEKKSECKFICDFKARNSSYCFRRSRHAAFVEAFNETQNFAVGPLNWSTLKMIIVFVPLCRYWQIPRTEICPLTLAHPAAYVKVRLVIYGSWHELAFALEFDVIRFDLIETGLFSVVCDKLPWFMEAKKGSRTKNTNQTRPKIESLKICNFLLLDSINNNSSHKIRSHKFSAAQIFHYNLYLHSYLAAVETFLVMLLGQCCANRKNGRK